MSETLERIDEMVKNHSVVLFMKGTPQFPQCGFSARVVEAMKDINQPFAWCNVLVDQPVRSELPQYQDWPTFPQLYLKGELVGGCDITMDLYQSGELKGMVEEAAEDFPRED
ncbi:MAG: Grx4 family monothiol glutaredoxin [Pseudomonadota bacterium]